MVWKLPLYCWRCQVSCIFSAWSWLLPFPVNLWCSFLFSIWGLVQACRMGTNFFIVIFYHFDFFFKCLSLKRYHQDKFVNEPGSYSEFALSRQLVLVLYIGWSNHTTCVHMYLHHLCIFVRLASRFLIPPQDNISYLHIPLILEPLFCFSKAESFSFSHLSQNYSLASCISQNLFTNCLLVSNFADGISIRLPSIWDT
jgi:hypothetical protein